MPRENYEQEPEWAKVVRSAQSGSGIMKLEREERDFRSWERGG